MNNLQTEAIANANAHLNNACLPLYEELVLSLEMTLNFAQDHAPQEFGGFDALVQSMNLLARARNQSFVVINNEGQFYTSAGNVTWSSFEELAQAYDSFTDARTIAALENGSVVMSSNEYRHHVPMPDITINA